MKVNGVICYICDPTWNPFVEAGFERITVEVRDLRKSFDLLAKGIRHTSYKPDGINLNESNEDTPLHGQITAFQRLINDGDVHSSLKQLLRLKGDGWSNASRSERYRILVGIASAKLKLGDQDIAGTLLLDAYNECPEHKDALKNRANGYLLTKDHKEAMKLVRLGLSFEARKLSRDDVIIDLLKGRIATDRESDGLFVLIAASINSGFWVTARETLDSVTLELQGKDWFKRAEAILAINTGDASTDTKIALVWE